MNAERTWPHERREGVAYRVKKSSERNLAKRMEARGGRERIPPALLYFG